VYRLYRSLGCWPKKKERAEKKEHRRGGRRQNKGKRKEAFSLILKSLHWNVKRKKKGGEKDRICRCFFPSAPAARTLGTLTFFSLLTPAGGKVSRPWLCLFVCNKACFPSFCFVSLCWRCKMNEAVCFF
jgi:hypothetical protein